MFNQAESVSINGKEVASIITADGGVLYQRNPGYDLALSCDKPILSFKDNDSCTITGVLTKDNLFIGSEEIGYQIVHNDTVLDEGILITDEFGEIALDYMSEGRGDVNVVFSLRNLLQKTYVVEDCDFTVINDTEVTTSEDKIIFDRNVTSDFIFTADYYPTNYWEWFIIKNTDNTEIIGVFSSSYDKMSFFGITDLGYNDWKNITIKLEGSTLTLEYGNTTVTSDVSQYLDTIWNFMVNHTSRFKNVKLKKL